MRRRRHNTEKPKAAIDMTSLIDLTFLLLVTFIVTLPALEQGISIKLPKGKADPLVNNPKTKPNVVSIDENKLVFLNEAPVTLEELRTKLQEMVAKDPDVPVHVKGDERVDYGNIMKVVKVLYDCKVTKMALVTIDKK